MQNRLIFFIIITFSFISAQSNEQIQQAKTLFKNSGMTESQARSLAKSKGYSDKQINAAVKKGKNQEASKDISKENNNLTIQKEVINKDVFKENYDDSKDKKSIQDFEDNNQELEIQDDHDRSLFKASQATDNNYKNFGYEIFLQDPSKFQNTSVCLFALISISIGILFIIFFATFLNTGAATVLP